MPILSSSFSPPRFLSNGHLQTILPVLLPRRFASTFVRERMELADGDFLDLDWLRSGHRRLAIITHGLEGTSSGSYVRGIAEALQAARWDALAWNFRGCSEELNRLPRFYHSGDTGDLAAIVEQTARAYDFVALVGFSLGGNITLKYLGEAPPHPRVKAAAAISAPVDLVSSARWLDRRFSNRLYRRRFITSLVAKMEAKALRYKKELNVIGARDIRTFEEFDGRYTAPMHGFRDAEDYWRRSSSRPYLPAIAIPTLLLNARNDPFLTPDCFPFSEAEASAYLQLETPDSGGHVGFLDLANGLQPWSERRVVEFLGDIAVSEKMTQVE